MNEQQRIVREQRSEARRRSCMTIQGYSVWGVIPQENPFPLFPPIHLYALHNLRVSRFVYIGQSKNPERRFVEHLSDAKRGDVNPEKTEWLSELQHIGALPRMTVLETLYGNRVQDASGCWWIAGRRAKTLEWVWAVVVEAKGLLVVNFSDRIARYGIREGIDAEVKLRIPVWNQIMV